MWSGTVVLLLCITQAAPAVAHYPPGVVRLAFRFPDQALPVIDGDLGDWALVAPEYTLTTSDLVDLVEGGSPDEADFSVRLQLGWSPTTNSLYVGARVQDDQHQVDRPAGSAATRIFQDDDMEVFVDADHSGGQFADFTGLDPAEALARNGTQASHFVISGPAPDGDYFVNFSAAGWYALADGPYTEAAVQYDAAAGVTSYEFRVVPFDLVNVHAEFLSDEHKLQAGEIIGFNVEFNDFDALSELYDAKWSLSGGQNAFRFADRFTDLMLVDSTGILPSDVESASWARIKAALARQMTDGAWRTP